MKIRIACLIAQYNKRDETSALLQSLEGLSYPDMEVFLLDNGVVHEERMRKDLKHFSLPIVYERSWDRLSSAAAHALLTRKALSAGFTHAWVLSGISRITPRYFAALLRQAEYSQIVGCSGGKHVGWRLGLAEVFEGSADWVGLSGMWFQLEKSLAVFDERFFNNFCSVDYCLRASCHGHRAFILPYSACESTAFESSLSPYFLGRNPLLYARLRLFGVGQKIALCGYVCVTAAKMVITHLNNRAFVRTYAQGVLDGLRLFWG